MPDYYKSIMWPSKEGDNFDRPQTLTTTPGINGWTVKDTSTGGTPTYLVGSTGMKLLCDNTSEAQIVTMYHNNVLLFDIDELKWCEMLVEVGGIDAVTTLVFGLAGSQNDTPDSVAQNAWFRMEGSASTSLVVCETDDGTTDNDDKATAVTLADTVKRFVIDFTRGTTDIRFYIDGARVASATTFSMSAYTGNLQPFVQLQKASGTGVPSVSIARWRMLYNKSYDG